MSNSTSGTGSWARTQTSYADPCRSTTLQSTCEVNYAELAEQPSVVFFELLLERRGLPKTPIRYCFMKAPKPFVGFV